VVLKNSFRNYETVAEVGRLIFRAFQFEMELDYFTVSRLLLVPVAKGCERIKNWFQLIIRIFLAAVLRSAALCIRLRNILRKWFVTTVLTLPICPATS